MLAKSVFTEAGSAELLLWIGQGHWLLAPDHVTVEMLAVAHKKAREGHIPASQAIPLVHDALRIIDEQLPSLPLATSALVVALQVRASLYDSLFLALAAERDVPLLTADLRLVERVRAAALEIACLTLADL